MENSKRAIEESFPIVEINRLAVPERNAFKPIYQMHKWFARRASGVFRALLLSSMKPLVIRITKNNDLTTLNTIDNSLSLPVIDGAARRADEFNLDAVERDR